MTARVAPALDLDDFANPVAAIRPELVDDMGGLPPALRCPVPGCENQSDYPEDFESDKSYRCRHLIDAGRCEECDAVVADRSKLIRLRESWLCSECAHCCSNCGERATVLCDPICRECIEQEYAVWSSARGRWFNEANHGSCERCCERGQCWRDVDGGAAMCWSCHHDERPCTEPSLDERCWADYLADETADPFEPEQPSGTSIARAGNGHQRCSVEPNTLLLKPLAKTTGVGRAA